MNQMEEIQFNQKIRSRTFELSLKIYHLIKRKEISGLSKHVAVQLLRSSSSVAANYRSATRGRSDAEYYSKICIVVEECDETQFWIEYLVRIDFFSVDEVRDIKGEVDQLTKLFTSIKQTMKSKITKK